MPPPPSTTAGGSNFDKSECPTNAERRAPSAGSRCRAAPAAPLQRSAGGADCCLLPCLSLAAAPHSRGSPLPGPVSGGLARFGTPATISGPQIGRSGAGYPWPSLARTMTADARSEDGRDDGHRCRAHDRVHLRLVLDPARRPRPARRARDPVAVHAQLGRDVWLLHEHRFGEYGRGDAGTCPRGCSAAPSKSSAVSGGGSAKRAASGPQLTPRSSGQTRATRSRPACRRTPPSRPSRTAPRSAARTPPSSSSARSNLALYLRGSIILLKHPLSSCTGARAAPRYWPRLLTRLT